MRGRWIFVSVMVLASCLSNEFEENSVFIQQSQEVENYTPAQYHRYTYGVRPNYLLKYQPVLMNDGVVCSKILDVLDNVMQDDPYLYADSLFLKWEPPRPHDTLLPLGKAGEPPTNPEFVDYIDVPLYNDGRNFRLVRAYYSGGAEPNFLVALFSTQLIDKTSKFDRPWTGGLASTIFPEPESALDARAIFPDGLFGDGEALFPECVNCASEVLLKDIWFYNSEKMTEFELLEIDGKVFVAARRGLGDRELVYIGYFDSPNSFEEICIFTSNV